MTPLHALRRAYQADGFNGFLIPRADRHKNETPPACDERLAYATGFTGSAGLAAVLDDRAALFVDGRYEAQAPTQVDAQLISVIAIRNTKPATWLREALAPGRRIAYDPWLHTASEIENFAEAFKAAEAELLPAPRNYVDQGWTDRPGPPSAPGRIHPEIFAGESAADKRARIGAEIGKAKLDRVVLTDPASICWLLNIRGGDTPNTPLLLAYALVDRDGGVELFSDPAKFDRALVEWLGPETTISDWDAFEGALASQSGAHVGVDRARAPIAISQKLTAAGATVNWRPDPCVAPRARFNAAEVRGARAAHQRDGAALCRFFCWLDKAVAAPQGGAPLNEAEIGARLIAFRDETGAALGAPHQEPSFDAIVAFGPNAALPHYRAPDEGSAEVVGDGLLLIDSGGQYQDGTTDITRMVAIGAPTGEMRAACTRVLQGMIAVSELVFPEKTPGGALDAFARIALWRIGLDYDHGTGHGVGSFLGVHDGPQRISQTGATPLEAGMVLSNEPGRYKPGAFGVRIENLLLVTPADTPTDALTAIDVVGDRKMHRFETLTLVPIDRRVLAIELLSADERAWLNAYHARVLAEVGPLLAEGPAADAEAADWLAAATAQL
ncbi:MAG: aminopeptidase P family protein [Neomegalonema sp.]|nr:aminopeptidase P family protein [Neomegalonema sp.]